MVNWKLRSKLYHIMTPDSGDDMSKQIIVEEWDEEKIIQKGIEYLFKDTKELYYPAKSYTIALVYSILLARNFGGLPLDYLKDPELLAGNDPYFKCYSEETKSIYDMMWPWILIRIDERERHSENFKRTLDYFHREFLLHDETKHLLPS